MRGKIKAILGFLLRIFTSIWSGSCTPDDDPPQFIASMDVPDTPKKTEAVLPLLDQPFVKEAIFCFLNSECERLRNCILPVRSQKDADL
ncbi:hypothetical protein OROHE_010570 [Orobanche hederae]